MSSDPIPVVAAVIFREDRVLLCQRYDGEHLPLLWEFPGGKIEPGETPQEALRRELREELGVAGSIGPQICQVTHAYATKTVHLAFYMASIEAEPHPNVHRCLTWVRRHELTRFAVPPPNAVVVRLLQAAES